MTLDFSNLDFRSKNLKDPKGPKIIESIIFNFKYFRIYMFHIFLKFKDSRNQKSKTFTIYNF